MGTALEKRFDNNGSKVDSKARHCLTLVNNFLTIYALFYLSEIYTCSVSKGPQSVYATARYILRKWTVHISSQVRSILRALWPATLPANVFLRRDVCLGAIFLRQFLDKVICLACILQYEHLFHTQGSLSPGQLGLVLSTHRVKTTTVIQSAD